MRSSQEHFSNRSKQTNYSTKTLQGHEYKIILGTPKPVTLEEAFKDGFPDPPPQNLLEIAMEQNPSGEFEERLPGYKKQNPPDDEENMTVDVLTQLVDEIIRLNLKNDEMLELLMVGPEQEK